MSNILLTEKCNRSCPYCFAKEHMSDSIKDVMLSWDDLIYIADFMEISHENHVSLLGGEPTLHPLFTDFIIYLLERHFHVNIFTNGIIAKDMLTEIESCLKKYTPDRLSFVCNVNPPDIASVKEIESVGRFLKSMNKYISLSLNIYKYDYDLEFAFQYIKDYDLKKHTRIGLAHPIPGEINSAVSLDRMDAMATTFINQMPLYEKNDVSFGFDCGMPICLFSDEQLGRMFKSGPKVLKFNCGPAIDIGPDMNVWSCFPLSAFHKRSLYEFDSLQQVISYFSEFHKVIRGFSGGLFEHCNNCIYRKREVCTGGCISHILSRLDEDALDQIKERYP